MSNSKQNELFKIIEEDSLDLDETATLKYKKYLNSKQDVTDIKMQCQGNKEQN